MAHAHAQMRAGHTYTELAELCRASMDGAALTRPCGDRALGCSTAQPQARIARSVQQIQCNGRQDMRGRWLLLSWRTAETQLATLKARQRNSSQRNSSCKTKTRSHSVQYLDKGTRKEEHLGSGISLRVFSAATASRYSIHKARGGAPAGEHRHTTTIATAETQVHTILNVRADGPPEPGSPPKALSAGRSSETRTDTRIKGRGQ